jgi:hypothetical protein
MIESARDPASLAAISDSYIGTENFQALALLG